MLFLSAKAKKANMPAASVRAAAYVCVVQEVLIVVILCGLIQFLVILGKALSDGVCCIRGTQAFPFGLSARLSSS